MGGCSVAVIGGGPAGTLCAAHFAKRGAHVTVYEPKTLAQQKSVQLGWSIAMGRMGTDAIDAAGLSSDFGPTYRCACSLTQTNSPGTFLMTQITLWDVLLFRIFVQNEKDLCCCGELLVQHVYAVVCKDTAGLVPCTS